MTTSDGYIVGTTKIVDHGPNGSRWNLVILSEGFRASELGTYHTAAQQFVDTLYTIAPFNELWCAINVHRVDVVSTESGADDPAACTDEPHASSVTRATYFDATFCHDGNTRRLIGGDSSSAWTVAGAQVPARNAVVVIVSITAVLVESCFKFCNASFQLVVFCPQL
jgi:hypothetical protein